MKTIKEAGQPAPLMNRARKKRKECISCDERKKEFKIIRQFLYAMRVVIIRGADLSIPGLFDLRFNKKYYSKYIKTIIKSKLKDGTKPPKNKQGRISKINPSRRNSNPVDRTKKLPL